MSSDPIVAEIHRVREQIAARFGYDIRAIGEDARRRDALGDRKVIRRPPRRPALPAKEKSQPSVASATEGS
jgi:hypothetical protein